MSDIKESKNVEADRILRLPEVLKLYPLGRSSWLNGVREGKFPASIKLSKRCVGWRYSEIVKLIEGGPAQ